MAIVVAPNMPRWGALNPVALATIACSKDTFDPSAKLVTIVGFCPHLSAKSFWVVGAVSVLEPLDVSHHTRDQPEAVDVSIQVDLHTWLVAVARGDDHARLPGVDMEDGSDGCIQLRVHRDQVFPMVEGVDRYPGAELHCTGHVDQHIDLRASSE